MDRTPKALQDSDPQREALAGWIGRFLFRLQLVAYYFIRRHPESSLFQFNTNYLFRQVLDNPARFPETAGLLNTTAYCVAYERYNILSLDSCLSEPTDPFQWNTWYGRS